MSPENSEDEPAEGNYIANYQLACMHARTLNLVLEERRSINHRAVEIIQHAEYIRRQLMTRLDKVSI